MFFLGSVCLISSFIIYYSMYYIQNDPSYLRFCFVLFFFVRSILVLIIRPNIIRLILGWDGLGLRSYALVIFYQNEFCNNSGMITVLSNRIGDSALLLSIGFIFSNGG